jgi:hypothetical protein
MIQGTANTPPANSVMIQAPISVPTAYAITLPGGPAAGFVKRTNTNPSVESVGAIAGADLPHPGVSSLGGVQSKDCSTGGVNAVQKINTDGSITCVNITGSSVFTGSTATASTGISGTAAAPVLSLSDQSTKSATRFEITLTASMPVTSVTVNNKTGGAKFSVAWTQPATNMVAVTWGASVFNTPCAVSQVANSTTTQLFEVGADGTTVSAVGCPSSDPVFAGSESAEDSTTTSGNGKLAFSFSAHTPAYYGNNSANRHIMPRTAGSTDQLSLRDLADGSSAGIISLFSGCTGTKVPQADGTCGTSATMPGAGPGFARVTSGGTWDTTTPLSVTDLPGDYICLSTAGSTTDYSCTPTTAPVAYVTGERYSFVADATNTAATGKPTITFAYLSPKQIVKVQGGISTALLTGDICTGQYVEMRYDGSHMQMMSPTCAVGANILYRCTVAGTLRAGATTTVAGDCGTAVDTGLRVN